MRTKEFVEREKIQGSGVYCFFPFDSLDSKKKGVFKIGMTGHFDNRIRGYHTYLPQGMYYAAFLKNPTLLKNGMDTHQYYVKIEKEIFKNIKDSGGQVIEMQTRKVNNGETEWIYASEKMIEDAFDAAYKKYKGKNTDLEIGTLSHLNRLKVKLERDKIFKGEIYFT